MASQDWFDKDFYKVLGVDKTASDAELKKTYRKLARQFHPDSNPGDAAAENRFKEISEAYSVLSDKEQRQEYDQVRAMRKACGDAHIKTILGTGELATLTNVAKASLVCMLAGADFIKTSTGKVSPAATLPVTLVMLEAVRDFRDATGRQVGMKPAGGIRTAKDAIRYLVLVSETVGDDWLTPEWFRFGASSLLNDLLMQRSKLATGQYSGPDYVTVD